MCAKTALNMEYQGSENQYDIISERDFESLYKKEFSALYRYAYGILQDEAEAEGVVQHVFLKLWEKREHVAIHTSWRSYLFRSVYHESLNMVKREQVKHKYLQGREEETFTSGSDKELRSRLQLALAQLPEKCRTVFQLSRFEELKYQEIADQLGVSLKTVEAHMGKALKTLRVQLAEFLSILIFLLTKFF